MNGYNTSVRNQYSVLDEQLNWGVRLFSSHQLNWGGDDTRVGDMIKYVNNQQGIYLVLTNTFALES